MQRLKNRAQFQAVMAGGTVSRTAHFALHRTDLDASPSPASAADAAAAASASKPRLRADSTPSGATGPGSDGSKALFAVRGEPWVGALVPKRWARRAVTRNAIKRQIYTVSQDFEGQLPAAAHVVRLRAGFDRQQFVSATSDALKRAVRAELQQLFANVRQKGSR